MKSIHLRLFSAAAGTLLLSCLTVPFALGQDGFSTTIDLFSKREAFISMWKVQSGDRPEWAGPAFDDSLWTMASAEDIRHAGIFWLRTPLVLKGMIDDADVLALHFSRWPPSFEVYWDGELIGRNGTIGDQGKFRSAAPRPAILRLGRERTMPGTHVLALRLSFKRRPAISCCAGVSVGYHSVLSASLQKSLDSMRMDVGLYLATVLFSLFFYLGGWKSPSLLFFSGYALYPLLYNIWSISDLSGTTPIPFPFLTASLAANGKLISSLMLILFLLWHLEVPKKAGHIIILTLAMLIANISSLITGRSLFAVELGLLTYGLGICIFGLLKKMPGGGFALAGFGALTAFQAAEFSGLMAAICSRTPSIPWPLAVTGFSLACLLGSISLKIRDRSRKLQALEIRSRRLETELLKKSIQPHFIMNTLFSIKSLAAKNPPKAEKLIEALAEEFRIISRIASEKEIDLQEEIDLCQRHLELMGYRRDASYRMIVEGTCSGVKIPPMVFHTLVENGLTHAYQPKENGTFWLVCDRTDKGIIYRLRNDGTRIQRLAGISDETIEEGMGLKYVKARLEESSPGCWRLNYGVRQGLWEVEIALFNKA